MKTSAPQKPWPTKLTNCQIEALVKSLELSIAQAARRGRHAIALRRQRRVEAYRAELQRRQAEGLNPGTEIQQSHIVPRQPEAA